MAFPTFTVTDLSGITGRPEASYTPFAAEAITQSFLLFKLATCLTDWPTDANQAALARYAVLSMADALTISQPYALTNGSPFSSESIGSYSYSRSSSAIKSGMPTGITWFDLAVKELGVCELGTLTGGGVSTGSIGVFEEQGTFGTKDGDESGKKYLLGPADLDADSDNLFYGSEESVMGPRYL